MLVGQIAAWGFVAQSHVMSQVDRLYTHRGYQTRSAFLRLEEKAPRFCAKVRLCDKARHGFLMRRNFRYPRERLPHYTPLLTEKANASPFGTCNRSRGTDGFTKRSMIETLYTFLPKSGLICLWGRSRHGFLMRQNFRYPRERLPELYQKRAANPCKYLFAVIIVASSNTRRDLCCAWKIRFGL